MKIVSIFIKIALLPILIFSGLNLTYAQHSPYKFDHLTINNGLSQNTVLCTMQDHEGFIWIGTANGLNRYDGYEFTIFKSEADNNKALSHNQINALMEDKSGRLWIGTSDGLNIFNRDDDSFKRISTGHNKSANENDFITSLIQDKKGNIWVGTNEGLKCITSNSRQIHSYIAKDGFKNKQVNKVQAIYQDNKQLLWVGFAKAFKRFNPETKQYLPLPAVLDTNKILKNSGIRIIKQDRQGRFWIGTETAGLFFYDPYSNQVINYRQTGDDKGLLSDIVRDIFIQNDEVWIGTREGLNILKQGKFTGYQYNKYYPGSLNHNSVRSIMKDKSGNLWFGTYSGGLNVIYTGSANFTNILEGLGDRPGLNHRVVSALIEADDHNLWVGTEGGGLNHVNLKNNTYTAYNVEDKAKGHKSNIVKSLVKDAKGNLWIGTYDGLCYFDAARQKLEIIDNHADLQLNHQLYALALDSNGLWLGTNGFGLQLIDKQHKLTTYLHNPRDMHSISNNNITGILKDERGGFWIGTQRGLNYLNTRSRMFTQFIHQKNDKESLNNNSVTCLFMDALHHLWVGTEGGGINLYDSKRGKFTHIGEKEVLNNNFIHAINQDKSGAIWISTNSGLSRLTFKNSNQAGSPPFSITNYTVADGLQSNQFSTGSSVSTKNGFLFFGGINGITGFDPEKLVVNKFKPPIVFTDFLIRNKSVYPKTENSPLTKQINQTPELTLTYDQAFISFKYAALNFVNPEKNQYAYKLEGFTGDNWHYVGNQRMATYTNLSAGTYFFKVKAANNDGVWSNQVKSIKLIVLPPWWKTWWAYLLYTVIISALLYLFYYYAIKTARLKNELDLEHFSHEKDQELAQRKLTFFTNISHEIKTPLTLIMAPLEKLITQNEGNNRFQNQLMLMQRNGDRLIRLINQLLDFRKFESGNMKLEAAEGDIIKFLDEIIIAFTSYANSRNIELHFESKQDVLLVYFDRDKLEKVMYNLLSNAVKFTQEGGYVKVSVQQFQPGAYANQEYPNGFVSIRVKDNGVGIHPENLVKIFDQFNRFNKPSLNAAVNSSGLGLAFSKGLIELHKGTIRAESGRDTEPDENYTIFTVGLPLGHSHLGPEQIVESAQDNENLEEYKKISEKAVLPLHDLSVQDNSLPIMLIVEDNPDLLQFMATDFSNYYQVHTGENGEKGWKKAIEVLPDIIISDVMMPGMNGMELCRKIKTDVRTSHIPVILLTARTPLIFKIEGLETGADDYITKPFSVSLLEARVRNLLESRKKLRERFRKEISLQPTNTAITSVDEKFLNKLMSFIEANIGEPALKVEELGREMGMSRATFYRKIKSLTNQSAIEFIRGIRLKRAAQLLKQNKFNINEVSFMVGFIDVDYFRKCFKEIYGCSPKEYAKSTDAPVFPGSDI